VYVNLLPKGYDRPSTLIEMQSVERADANISTVAVKASFVVTCYVEVDGHYQSDVDRLMERQDKVMSLFSCGYLQVGDRFLEVRAETGGMDFTESVELELDYFDDRYGGADDGESLPLMETIETRMTEG